MHEFGHSIGIGIFEIVGLEIYEVYGSDSYSVMSALKNFKAGNYWNWYYSNRYWNTKNLEYYTE